MPSTIHTTIILSITYNRIIHIITAYFIIISIDMDDDSRYTLHCDEGIDGTLAPRQLYGKA